MPKPARIDPGLSGSPGARPTTRSVRVWDPVVRIFHWGLVASFATAWFTARTSDDIHQYAGYLAGMLVIVRLGWGAVGTRYARFSQFVRSPSTVARYLVDMTRGAEPRYLGHNPAGGLMILILLCVVALTAFTGWMMTTDAYFGVTWVEDVHSLAAHGMLVLIALHVGGVVLASMRHRENLARAMITGRKREAESADVS